MGATASPAIELVGFDEEVRSAVEYVFGSTLVVDGMDAANKICDATKTRTVTLQGDVYDPSGTISGGSSNNLGSTLVKLSELTIASSELEMKETHLKKVASKLQGMASLSKKYGSLSDKLEIADAELSGIQKHLSQTSYGMLSENFNSMSKEIKDANIEIEAMQKEKDVKWNLYNELKDKEADLTRQREDRLKEIDQKVKDAKATAAEKSKISREVRSWLWERSTFDPCLSLTLHAFVSFCLSRLNLHHRRCFWSLIVSRQRFMQQRRP
jgi:structural maintenance of chromosome 2